jgi:PAS domain S-box-containing protein
MIITLGWWILVLMTFGISLWPAYLYLKDRDKRKLMFFIAFFLSLFVFLFNALDFSNRFADNIFILNVFQWTTLPIIIALLISVVESFYPSKDFERGFLIFAIFSVVSFGFVFFPFEIQNFFRYFRMLTSSGVIFFSAIQIVKWKNVQSVFFIIAMISFTIAGVAHGTNQMELSVYAYAVAYLFVFLVFFFYSSTDNLKSSGLKSYFSLQKQLTSARSALQKSKELYKSIVENTQDVILLTDMNGKNSYVSPSSEKVLGVKPDEFLNTTTWPFDVHPDDTKIVNEAMRKGFAGYPGSNLEYKIITKDNSVRWVSHSWTPLKKNGEIQTIVSSIKDITNLKKTQQELAERVSYLQRNELATLNIMEDFQESIESLKNARDQIDEKNAELKESQLELKKLNDELEQRVQDRTREIERLLKQKDAFIDQLGHDLKHPLGPLINLLPLLKKQESDEKKKDILSVLERNVDYMKHLVIRTVKLAKLNAPSTRFDYKEIELHELIKKVIEKNKSTFEENDVVVNADVAENILIHADPLQIEEVLENLISNAMKYGSEHGFIELKAKVGPKDEIVLISVKDTGHGMSSEQIENVFNEFYKADESRHDFTSTGLGLSICKRIVEKHDGQIWAESEGIGKGSTITFSLPLVKEKVERYIE